jgi:hypothetical protein
MLAYRRFDMTFMSLIVICATFLFVLARNGYLAEGMNKPRNRQKSWDERNCLL